MTLTDIQCKNAKPKDKAYKLTDGGGMYLEVSPSGSKYWRLKYRLHNKEKRLAIGVYPSVSLSEARDKREEAKRQIKEGIDPVFARKDQKRIAGEKANNTLKAIALEWLEVRKDGWSEGYALKIKRRLEMHIFPYMGSRPISSITTPEFLDALRKVEKHGGELTLRVKQYCSMIFRYGIQTGRCERDITDGLQGALKPHKTKHHAALDIKELPEFLKVLERNEMRLYERTRRALWFSLLTFARPGEIRQAQWLEIDWDQKEWRISAEKMKMRRDHIVPLSDQAIEILKAQQNETGHINTDWVFPSQKAPKDPMSENTVNQAIQRLGYGDKMKAHGFRALARTAIREKLKYDSEIIEKQLAHKTRNPLGEAYDRTQFLDERKLMMQNWADYIEIYKPKS